MRTVNPEDAGYKIIIHKNGFLNGNEPDLIFKMFASFCCAFFPIQIQYFKDCDLLKIESCL